MQSVLDEHAIRVIRQHAQTSNLLGVGFVPVSAITPAVAQVIAQSAPSAPIQAQAQVQTPIQTEASTPLAPPSPIVEPKASGAVPQTRSAATRIEIPDGELNKDKAQGLLDQVLANYEADAPHQHFATDHHSIVFGDGDPIARLMFVGEAPGEQEDREGRPFVGRSGQLLDKMIVAMGLSRESVYIANVLKTRPPNNQTPTIEEAELCAPYLLDQIRVVQPSVIVTLGLPASRLLLGTREPMRAMRGAFRQFPSGSGEGIFGTLDQEWIGEPIPVMPTYHPAYLLRSYTPENRKKVWNDLQMVMDRLGARV